MRYLALVTVLLAAGCASPAAVPGVSICPKVADYSPEENAAIVMELSVLDPGDVLVKLANEDHRLRAELKACRAP
jgi:hypothetical protein